MDCSLGIDIGTSKVAIVVLNRENKVEHIASEGTNAQIACAPGYREQDVLKILSAATGLIKNIPHLIKKRICCIGLTGQMHGMMLWSSSTEDVSSLITWEDERCLEGDFLEQLRQKTEDSQISSGYGNATLSWLAQHQPEILRKFDRASCIQDFFAAKLCGLTSAVTDNTDAASWGFFNLEIGNWDFVKLEKAGIPTQFAPSVYRTGSRLDSIAAHQAEVLGLSPEVQVMIPCGDNQASLLATLENSEQDIALTLGTGAQISVVIDNTLTAQKLGASIEIRPYFDGKYLMVAASLCGGSVMQLQVQAIVQLFADLGCVAPSLNSIYQSVDRLARQSLDTEIVAETSFKGERHDPKKRASFSFLSDKNLSIGDIFASSALGTINNLKNLFPAEMLESRKIIVGSGNALRRLEVLRLAVQKVFKIPLVIKEASEEAARGAALAAFRII